VAVTHFLFPFLFSVPFPFLSFFLLQHNTATTAAPPPPPSSSSGHTVRHPLPPPPLLSPLLSSLFPLPPLPSLSPPSFSLPLPLSSPLHEFTEKRKKERKVPSLCGSLSVVAVGTFSDPVLVFAYWL
ncbi:unnamed protein product, partial [Coffea canephora]